MLTTRATPLIVFPALAATAMAFTPSPLPNKKWSIASASYTPMKRVNNADFASSSAYRCKKNNGQGTVQCRMATDAEAEATKLREQAKQLREEAAEAAGVSVEELATGAKNSDGTVYDDEPILERENVSAAMKERLMREASTGLDSNKSQTNVILYISVGVAILVLLGGQGILF